MTFRGLLVVIAASALGACAGSDASTSGPVSEFFTLKFADSPPTDVAAAPTSDAAQVDAFTIEVSIERLDGRRLAGPTLTAFAGQTASIAMVSRANTGDAASAPVEDGMRLDACAQRAADGNVALGYRVRLAKAKPPESADGDAKAAPTSCEVVAFEGARSLEPGVQGLLGRLVSPDGTGTLLVLARVHPIRVDAPPPGALDASAPDAKLSRALIRPTLHLRVTAAAVPRDFAPGSVIDETATSDVMKPIGGRILRDFEMHTCVDSRVRIEEVLESGGRADGLVVDGRDDGRLDLTWTTNGVARKATIRPSVGRRFVALSRIEGGGTAGVMVVVDVN